MAPFESKADEGERCLWLRNEAAYTRAVATPKPPPQDDEMVTIIDMVSEFPPLDSETTAGLLASVGYEGLDEDPRRQLVQHHLWMVLEEASAAARAGTSTGDLFQEGTTALLKLVHGLSREQPLTPEQFRARARQVAAASIAAALEEESRARAQDEQWARDGERLFALEVELRKEAGQPPTDTELAARLGWSGERVRQLRRAVSEAAAQHDRELAETIEEMEEE